MTFPYEEIRACKKETVSYMGVFKVQRLVFEFAGEDVPFQSFLNRERLHILIQQHCAGSNREAEITSPRSASRRRAYRVSGMLLLHA